MPRPVKMFRSASNTSPYQPETTLFGRKMEEWAFDWTGVDGKLLACAICNVNIMGAALMITAAAGGRGVAIKIYQNKTPVTAVALDPPELHAILNELIDHFGSPSEDTREVFGISEKAKTAAK